MLTYASFTNAGDRDNNEDNLSITQKDNNYVFCVADGLGGHNRGEVASQIAVETFRFDYLESEKIQDMRKFLSDIFEDAQQTILTEQERRKATDEMKTTAVSLFCNGNQLCWGHIGDSRLYAFRKNKVVDRTLDHSVPQMLVLAGEIKEKAIRYHPDRNRLLRVLGTPWGRNKYEISEIKETENYQAFLLCTDGFWELIDEKMMCKLLKKTSNVKEWLLAMSEEVLNNGRKEQVNMDNYTAIAVWL